MTAETLANRPLSFTVPANSEATGPAEARGLARDEVRLLVSSPQRTWHVRFRDLPDALTPGDLLVVNTSATLPAAIDGRRADGAISPVHVATALDDGAWVVEVRRPDNAGPQTGVQPGERIELHGGVELDVEASYPIPGVVGSRLWRATPHPPVDRTSYLLDHGRPVRYGYLAEPWPLRDLQTVFADEPGSAEMPSAGRPFTSRLLVKLLVRGITVAPVVLHAGVSSPEKHEPPVPEWFRVPEATARLVSATRAAGGRVTAVGTTVTRALETVAGPDGRVTAGFGWTDLVLGPDRPARVVTGLVTGLHEPEASHLQLLQAVAGRELVATAYESAVAARYLWHEFGDSMLFLP